MTQIEIYTDGACRKNPGPGSWAFMVTNYGTEIYKESAAIAGETTNNRAEYFAIGKALMWAIKNNHQKFIIHSDSEIVINQLNGDYKVKEPELVKLYTGIQTILNMLDNHGEVTFNHVPRTHTGIQVCDKMCNATLDCMETNTPVKDKTTWIRKITYECPECGDISTEPEPFCEKCNTILALP